MSDMSDAATQAADRPGSLEARSIAAMRTICVIFFLARAWQHLRWDPPYRAFLLREETMQTAVESILGLPWIAYANSPVTDHAFTLGIKIIGVFYLGCAWAAFRCERTRRGAQILLGVASVMLAFLAYCCFCDRLFFVGELLEYSTQIAFPMLLLLAVRGALHSPVRRRIWSMMGRVAVALTFLGHGLYAIGYHATPNQWIIMTGNITGLDERAALIFLRIAGAMDLFVAGLILAPWRQARAAALAYAAAWGFLTALARPAAFIRWDGLGETSAQWMHEAAIRLPHAALPLVLWWLIRQNDTIGDATPALHPQRNPTLPQ